MLIIYPPLLVNMATICSHTGKESICKFVARRIPIGMESLHFGVQFASRSVVQGSGEYPQVGKGCPQTEIAH